jgi:hypothetical protein
MPGQVGPGEPAEERRLIAQPLAQRLLLGTAAGEDEVTKRLTSGRCVCS